MQRFYRLGGLVLTIIIAMAIIKLSDKQPAPVTINHASLLDVIAKGESKGNYNAYFGNTHNQSIEFTKMTLKEVLDWQADFVNSGSPSNAVGKYQFIRPTLLSLVKERGIDPNERFDEQLQDDLAIALLEKRGLNEYVEGKIGRDQFANNLSKEWAALPQVTGDEQGKSYYDGDGLNKARTSVDEVYEGINKLEKEIEKDKPLKAPKDE